MQSTEHQSLSPESQWARRMVKELWSKDLRKPKNHTDLEIRCNDGKVEAHRAYLQKYCIILRKIIKGIECIVEPKLVIVLPDVRISTVRNFLNLLYTGSVNLTSEMEMESIKELAFGQLGFQMPLDCVKHPIVNNVRSFKSHFPQTTPKSVGNCHSKEDMPKTKSTPSTKSVTVTQKDSKEDMPTTKSAPSIKTVTVTQKDSREDTPKTKSTPSIQTVAVTQKCSKGDTYKAKATISTKAVTVTQIDSKADTFKAKSTISTEAVTVTQIVPENDTQLHLQPLDMTKPKVLSNESIQFSQKPPLPKGFSSSLLMQIKKEMCKAIVGPSVPLPDDQLQIMEPVCVVDEENEDLSPFKTTPSNFVLEEKYHIPKKDSLYGPRYILDAPTSGLVKTKEDRMTYINMAKFYELTLAYSEDPDASPEDVGVVRSVIMVLFRGKITEEEELKAWQHWHSKQFSSGFSFQNRNIIEADLFNFSGIIGKIEQIALNAIEVYWTPTKSLAKLNISVLCLSTDFSDQKGVRGQPLHLQIDTYFKPNDPEEGHVVNHRGYAQIKIFRDKGAERKLRDEGKQVMKLSQKLAFKKFPSFGLQPPSEQTEFYSMLDTNNPPFLFRPQSTQNREALVVGNQHDEENTDSDDDEVIPEKRQRLEGRIMIFLKQSEDEAYTPLHVVPPTVLGLKEAIRSKCTLPFELRYILRRSKHGTIVKFDDEMIKFYSHNDTFIMELSSLTENGETLYDLTLTEA